MNYLNIDFPKINLHIHSNYSDGTSEIPKIVKTSISYGLNYIAITDHFTNSWKAKIIPSLDSKNKINSYLYEITQCQEIIKDHQINLKILKGIEIDISSSKTYILNLINPLEFDLILFEYLESPEGIAFIRNLLIYWKSKISDQMNFPLLGLAHFDPSFFIYGQVNILLHFLREWSIYYEFNSSYPQYYSKKYQDFFSRLKEHNILVAVGSDSHDTSSLADIKEPFEMIQEYKLENNLMSLINLL